MDSYYIHPQPPLERAIQPDLGIERSYLDPGILDAEAGKRDDAVQQFRKAAAINPNHPDVHWRLEWLYHAMGRKEGAKIEFDRTTRLHKTESDSVFTQFKAAQPMSPAARSLQLPTAVSQLLNPDAAAAKWHSPQENATSLGFSAGPYTGELLQMQSRGNVQMKRTNPNSNGSWGEACLLARTPN